jgi:two-component system OmpR family response regulator
MTSPPQLLIVEDDSRLANLIETYFTRAGFQTHWVDHGQQAIDFCHSRQPDLTLLDLMLPDMDGITVLRQIRQRYQGKVLMMTASGSDIDQVMGLESGADDYVIKPVEPRVLLARVNSLLKRRAIDKQTGDHELVFGTMTINNQTQTVTLNGQAINLTTHEFELLYLLARHAGTVLTRDDIYNTLRGLDYDGADRAVDIKISRLRKKLGDDATEPQRIKTIWGKGYLFVPSAWNG